MSSKYERDLQQEKPTFADARRERQSLLRVAFVRHPLTITADSQYVEWEDVPSEGSEVGVKFSQSP